MSNILVVGSTFVACATRHGQFLQLDVKGACLKNSSVIIIRRACRHGVELKSLSTGYNGSRRPESVWLASV